MAFFESKVRPLLIERCHECHSAASGKSKGGLRLDSLVAILQGGDSGPALVAGKPEKSLLIQALAHSEEVSGMPPKGKLPDGEIATLTAWVKSGATWPAELAAGSKKPSSAPSTGTGTHWAWQPLKHPAPPAVRDKAWGRQPVDAFILAALEAKGLSPAPAASRQTLIRRLSLDLTGLPPTPEEVEAFCQDTHAGAVEALVERLLASSRFGERWGRHWLDVARYSDSIGGGMNLVLDDAWRYRDYVISSFNADKPYDRFVTEQIAGDLLPAGDEARRVEQIVATGFLLLGVTELGEYDREKLRMDIVDEQLDTLGKTFLGLTLGCARCHDHKFDPVPARDYYAMAGIMRSTNPLDEKKSVGMFGKLRRVPLPQDAATTAAIARATQELAPLKKELAEVQAALKTGSAAEKPALEKRQESIRAEQRRRNSLIAAMTPMILAVGDEAQPKDSPIFIRGDVHNPGQTVPRGFLTLARFEGTPAVSPRQSGRLELARWMTHPDQPLLARVMANRVWHWLMGAGLVRSVDNFGLRGEQPSHPALLDYLARRFIQQGWSVKALIREMVLSKTYQQGSEATPATVQADPENRLWGWHPRRRLEAEEIHDALLLVSGALDPTLGGQSNTRTGRLGSEGEDAFLNSDPRQRRGIYQPIYRGGMAPDLFRVFDFPDAGLVTGSRNVTTVATQALYLLNSPEMLGHARRTAARLLAERSEDAGRLQRLHQWLFGRDATGLEVQRARDFLKAAPGSQDAAWAALCHSLMISTPFLFVE